MKAEELRIGNFVHTPRIKDATHYEQVTGIDSEVGRIETGHEIDDSFEYEDIQPIPLIEYWLKKFDYEEDNLFGNWHLNQYKIYSHNGGYGNTLGVDDDGGVHWYFACSDDYYSWTKRLKYVHQLQNMYFVNRDAELTIQNGQTTSKKSKETT